MGLKINNNVEAQDTLRNLTTAQSMFTTAMQRLSSGKRINSAADDAAGYAISNKLQSQSTGLDQAQSNAQDGISMIQTATGGLQTTQSLLQRLRQLAVQSSNDTNTSSDRQALQSEADQISQEITQIANTTQFNTKNLLDGAQDTSTTYSGGTINGNSITTSGLGATTTATVASSTGALANGSYSVEINSLTNGANAGSVSINGTRYDLTAASTAATSSTDGTASYTLTNATAATNFGLTITLDSGTNNVNPTVGGTVSFTVANATQGPVTTGGVTLQVGANSSQSLEVGISAMDSYSLGVSAVGTGNQAAVYNAGGNLTTAAETTGALDISTQTAANGAISVIDAAIQQVSTQSAALGAVQNRLTEAISNLQIGSENMTSAYSAITDVNMAEESTALATAQILQQSSTAMLAQANSAPQGVLKLLQ